MVSLLSLTRTALPHLPPVLAADLVEVALWGRIITDHVSVTEAATGLHHLQNLLRPGRPLIPGPAPAPDATGLHPDAAATNTTNMAEGAVTAPHLVGTGVSLAHTVTHHHRTDTHNASAKVSVPELQTM